MNYLGRRLTYTDYDESREEKYTKLIVKHYFPRLIIEKSIYTVYSPLKHIFLTFIGYAFICVNISVIGMVNAAHRHTEPSPVQINFLHNVFYAQHMHM